MKHLRLFENIDGKDVVLDAMLEHDRVCNLIRDFINFEKLYIDKAIKEVVYFYFEKNVSELGDRILFAVIGDFDRDEDTPSAIMLNEEQQKDLYEFVKNPKVYKNMKKYNI